MTYIPILHLGVKLKVRGRSFNGNICITPNGTHVARYGDSYMEINNKRELIQGAEYLGREGANEIWRKETKNREGDYRYTIKKIKIN